MTEVLASPISSANKNVESQKQKSKTEMGTKGTATILHDSLVMNDDAADLRVYYQCGPPPSTPDAVHLAGCSSTGSPRQQMKSPRCEAFLMTGEKMLSLNPKISPCYAKLCHNQLPPTVEVDSEEKHAITPTKSGQFDQFPSMQKNGKKWLQMAPATAVGDATNVAAASMMPQSSSEHVLESRSVNAGNSREGVDMAQEKEPSAVVGFGDSGGNMVPADPSNRRYYQSSVSTLPENLTSSEVVAENQRINQLPVEKASTLTRFMSSESQSTPNSPAHVFKQQGAKQQHKQESTDALAQMQSAYSSETVARLARHLFTHQEGIKIAAFLVKSDDLSLRIAHEFVALFNFAGIRVDAALRTFLSHVRLTGETGDRAQLLSHFSQRYHECNPTLFNSADEIHALTCALLLLNTDLHGKQNNKRMGCRDFIENLAHTDFKYNPAMLKELYAAVKEKPFHQKPGDEPPATPTEVGMGREKRLSRVLSKRGASVSSGDPLITPDQQIDYKHGWLLKKSLYDSDGKKTPIGRRKWQMLYATIRGMVLYLHLNENSFSSGHYITYRNCILLHHSLAEIPRDYEKRKNVFRLRTAGLGEFLFQTSDPNEVQKWIDAINYVAAAFSTPALPTPVGANGVVAFYRPHLPSTPTHLSIPDQLRAHEQRLDETTANLARLRENAPPMKAKGKCVYDYFYKERFLDKERERYTVYAQVLREKLARASSTLRCDSQSTSTLISKNKQQQQAIVGNGNSNHPNSTTGNGGNSANSALDPF